MPEETLNPTLSTQPINDEATPTPASDDDQPNLPPTAVVTHSPGLSQPQRKEDRFTTAAKSRAQATGLTRDILNWLKQRGHHFAF